MYVWLFNVCPPGRGVGGPAATTGQAGPGSCGAALCGEYAPLLQSGVARREIVAVQCPAPRARGLRAQPTVAVVGEFYLRGYLPV